MVAETSPNTDTVAQPEQGYTVSLTAVPRIKLIALLTNFLQRDPTWGLVEGLAATCWLGGQSDGTAEIYGLVPDRQTPYSERIPAADLVAHWSTGRVFDQGVEWRWRKVHDDLYGVLGLAEAQAVLLTGMQTLTGIQDESCLHTMWHVTPGTQHLIGSIIDESKTALAQQTWREVRNPYPLIYPTSHACNRNRQPRLQTYIYATRTGIVRFTRFYELTTLDIKGD